MTSILDYLTSFRYNLMFYPAFDTPDTNHKIIHDTDLQQAAIVRKIDGKHKRCMLIAHGNAGNIYHRDNLLTSLSGYPYDIYCFEYDGFGLLKGKPGGVSIGNCVSNCLHWLDHLAKQYDEIDVYGESIGGGVITETLATMQDTPNYRPVYAKIRNIYLQSTFCSISRLLNKHQSWLRYLYDFVNWNDLDTFNNLLRIANGYYDRKKQRVVIIHSPTDEIVPYSEAVDNFNRCGDLGISVLLYTIEGTHNQPRGLHKIK